MSYALIDTTDLTTLGDAIRTKTGETGTMSVAQMATAVNDISGGGIEFSNEDLTINVFGNNWGTYDCQKLLLDKLKENNKNLTIKATSNYYTFNSLFSNCTRISDLSNVIIDADSFMMSANWGISCNNGFYNASNLTKLPQVVPGVGFDTFLQNFFYSCTHLSSDEINKFFRNVVFQVGNSIIIGGMFQYCNEIIDVDETMNKLSAAFYNSSMSGSTGNFIRYLYNGCTALKSAIVPLPPPNYSITNDQFMSQPVFGNNWCLGHIKFYVPDVNNVASANYKNQMIYLDLGYMPTSYNGSNGFVYPHPEFVYIYDQTTYDQYKNNDNAVVGKPTQSTQVSNVTVDGDTVNALLAYSKFNHAAAVEFINSLPATPSNSNNNIFFKRHLGALTDDGGVDALTSAEIAVATDRNWTINYY